MDWHMDEISCDCGGGGWGSYSNIWFACPVHYNGQLHPDTRNLLLDDPSALSNAERMSLINYKLTQSREVIADLRERLLNEMDKAAILELELVNKTPTLPTLPKFDCEHLDKSDQDWTDAFPEED